MLQRELSLAEESHFKFVHAIESEENDDVAQ